MDKDIEKLRELFIELLKLLEDETDEQYRKEERKWLQNFNTCFLKVES